MFKPNPLSKSVRKSATRIGVVAFGAIMTLSACGGGDGSSSDKISEEYDRIEDQISDLSDDIVDSYKEFEDKLTDDEKSMSEILESIFLPNNAEEDFEEFLDKLTPEGGKGGLYVGHFVELDDGDDDDIDIGAIYFDISDDAAGSVDGRISYQQQPCQNNQTISTDLAVKVDNYISGNISGSLDTAEILDIKYINDLDIETANILTTFAGSFNENSTGEPWTGSFEYQDGLGGVELSSGKDDCDVTYTLGQRSNFVTYPLDYQLPDDDEGLSIEVAGTGSTARITWENPSDTALVLVSQINVNKAESGANGFVRNQVFKNGETQFDPRVNDTPTNYAFLVQAFDEDNDLIGYDALVMDLPEANVN